MLLPTLSEIQDASQIVYEVLPPTPQYRWPLLRDRLGLDVWVKHENHTPVGAFKIRGGLVYFSDLAKGGAVRSVVAATRGNHGQSVALSAASYGIAARIVVPHGNSLEKNAAMRSLGAELIEHGRDFQEALEQAARIAGETSAHLVPSFHPLLVRGVATYAVELFKSVSNLDSVYVPIGLGSGICGVVAARNALSPQTRIVGVVSSLAPAYSLSFASRRPIEAEARTEIADGVACRVPRPEALDIILRYAEKIVEVSDVEVGAAMRLLYECTHNCAEGAGAAALAAVTKGRQELYGKSVAMILTGGNVDRPIYASILSNSL
jgi:threonine dehydratase